MVLKLFRDKRALAAAAAEQAGTSICHAITEHGKARIVAATGASQFEFLEALTNLPAIDWKQVEMFHLDEYIGLPASHPASFSNYLQQRLIQKTGITQHHLLNGDGDPAEVIRRASQALRQAPVDVAFVGVGENGHLAFNDPPADFETEEEYLIVTLDEACRRQQLGEGWFKSLAEVPQRAISMSVRQILKARKILCAAPDKRKAQAVKNCVEHEVSADHPSSILQQHGDTTIFLDSDSASLLQKRDEVGA